MGIAQIALDPPPLSNWQTWGKKCPKPSWQALTPPLPLTSNVYMETEHFKKGASLTHSLISGSVVSNICIIAHFQR